MKPVFSVITGGSATAPVPASETSCEEFNPEYVKDRVALLLPIVEGVNVTETVQLDPTVNVLPHVLPVIAKSIASAPTIAIDVIDNGAVPKFDNVTTWAPVVLSTVSAPKLNAPRLSDGMAAAIPVPTKLKVVDETALFALVISDSEPDKTPF